MKSPFTPRWHQNITASCRRQTAQLKSHQCRTLSSASPARSLGQGATRSNGSSNSSSSLNSEASNAASTSFYQRHWDEQLLAHTSFFCRHRPLAAPVDHHGLVAKTANAHDILSSAMVGMSLSQIESSSLAKGTMKTPANIPEALISANYQGKKLGTSHLSMVY
jgi:hypothetical protein